MISLPNFPWKKLKPLPARLSFLAFFALLAFLFLATRVVKNKEEMAAPLRQIFGFRKLLPIPTPAPYPINKNASSLPEISARSAIIVDVNSSVVLFQKYPNQRLLPASTTKIMTAILALENYRLDQILTVGQVKIDGNSIKLLPGEQMTVENLLYGLLVGSGNDAAEVLAENFPEGKTGFIWAMNQKAQQLQLTNTHFTNPVGYDEEGHYSTAADLAQLTLKAIQNPVFSRMVSTEKLTITDVSGTINHPLKNTNELIGELAEVKGVKTGWTQNAGECLVSLIEKNNEKLISVILASNDRFGETKTLIKWIFENFEWQAIAPAKYQ